jgi:hypothetical protein
MSQDRHASCQMYLDRFQNCVEVIEHSGALIGIEPGLVDATMMTATPPMTRATATEAEVAAAEAYTRNKYLAYAFLAGACRHWYGKLIKDLENDYTMAIDKYPKTLTEVYNLLVYWKQDPRNLMRVLGTSIDGVAFANVGDKDTGESEGDEVSQKKTKKQEGSQGPHHLSQMRKAGSLCK